MLCSVVLHCRVSFTLSRITGYENTELKVTEQHVCCTILQINLDLDDFNVNKPYQSVMAHVVCKRPQQKLKMNSLNI